MVSVSIQKPAAPEAAQGGRVKRPFWWTSSGRGLARMLQESNYPEEVQHSFLTFYRNNVVPLLGDRPDETTPKSMLCRDGSPFEYSFELKSSSQNQGVRIALDLTQLRPADKSNPLGIATSQRFVDILSQKTPAFDDTWYRALRDRLVRSGLFTSEQNALIAKVGQQSSVVMGFDVHRQAVEPGKLPGMGKVYFLPCFAAAAEGITNWQATRSAIQQLPGINSYPNILKSLEMINDYLSDKEEVWQMGARFLAVDLVAPANARLKLYLRCSGTTFEEIWDYYTLGGRIPNLDQDKEKFQALTDTTSGRPYDESRPESQLGLPWFTSNTRKHSYVYFSLSARNPYPAPKLGLYPANFAPNDEVIVKGLDRWLDRYGWPRGGKSMEEQLKTVFTHRNLAEKTGLFTFVGLGRKEGPAKNELSMQLCHFPADHGALTVPQIAG
ncbi:hypothetical protein FQN52_007238 [Onygenales sp. PD_12]|nr:hypothetical protein FQN52_007238 [Onygenales sp. PD_12]